MKSSHKEIIVLCCDPERIPAFLPLLNALVNHYQVHYLYRAPEATSNPKRASFKNLALLKHLKNTHMHPLTDSSFLAINNVSRSSIKQFRLQFFFENLFKKDYMSVKKLFSHLNIKAILLVSDKYYGDGEMALTRLAQEKKIPIHLPTTFYHGPSIAAFKNNLKFVINKHSSWYQKLTFQRLSDPKYGVQTHLKHFFYPAPMLNVLVKHNLLTKNPWYIGAGICDSVLVDNVTTFQRYVDNGTPKEKIHIVGNPLYDRLYKSYNQAQTLKKKYINKYDLNPEKKTVVIAWPELSSQHVISAKDQENENVFLLQSLLKLHVNVLVSLHPKAAKVNYQFLMNAPDVHIINEELIDIIAIADLFTCTYSSTVVWAVICGIKTVVFDFYDLNYSMYDFLESISIVTNKVSLSNVWIECLDSDTIDFTKDWQQLSRNEVFDGQTIPRHLRIMGLS